MHRTVIEVQHHHAHLASLLAEHQLSEQDTVIGFVFDGTGYGCDRTIWGGEVLVGGYRSVHRVGHLRTVTLPGGAAAVARPYRMALSHLAAARLPLTDDLAPVRACDPAELDLLTRQLTAAAPASPITSSMGRLFDAVAALLDVRQRISYEAQAAIELEHLAAGAVGERPPAWRFGAGPRGVLDPAPVLAALVDGLGRGVDRAVLALGFHHAVADAVVRSSLTVQRHHRAPQHHGPARCGSDSPAGCSRMHCSPPWPPTV